MTYTLPITGSGTTQVASVAQHEAAVNAAIEERVQARIDTVISEEGAAGILLQAEAAKTSAETSAAEAALYDGPTVEAFAGLADLTPEQVDVGRAVRDISTGGVYKRLLSGGVLDYSGGGGITLDPIAGIGIGVSPQQFGALPRFAGATGRATSTDCSVQMQAALDWVANQNTMAGLKRFKLIIDDYYAATGLTMKSNCWVQQTVQHYQGGIICPNGAAAGRLVQLDNADVVRITVQGLYINGNAANQSNTIDGFYIDLADTSDSMVLRDFVVDNLNVENCTGRNIHVGAFTRRSVFTRIKSRFSGEVGFYYAGSDCTLYDFDVSQSVGDGFVCRASAGKISKGKVWYSGRVVSGSTARGYAWESGNCIISDCEAQENAGYGHEFFRSGQTLKGIIATNLTSDSDNAGGAVTSGINIFNVQDSRITAFSGELNAALAGNPISGLSISGGSKNNDISLTTSGLSSWPWVINADSTENKFSHNGDRIIAYTNIATTITPNSMAEGGFSGTLQGDTTINNPGRKVRGFRLQFWIKQAANASYLVTWGSDFVVNTPLNREFGSTTYFEFVSDGAKWIDQSPPRRVIQETATTRTLTLSDAGKVFDNAGAAALAEFTLPAAGDTSAGAVFEFMCVDTDGIKVIAPSGNTIRIAGSESGTFGSATTTTIGSTLRVIRGGANKWVALSSLGTWTVSA